MKENELREMQVALSFLLPLVATVGFYLDVTLPFPCCGARGFEEANVCGNHAMEHHLPVESELSSSGTVVHRSKSKEAATPQSAWWAQPCVLHPFTRRWSNFSICDGVCTSEFMTALQLLDEDLRRLCASQGEAPPADSSTLQLLASGLSAANLGCVSPPSVVQESSAASISLADTSSLAASSTLPNAASAQVHDSTVPPKTPRRRTDQLAESSAGAASPYEDGDWTVV
jgi:hypothetical protein